MPPNGRLLARMTERMREGRHETATQDFCDLLRDGARPGSLGREAIAGASPFLNVPAHTMVTDVGEIRTVNYDHTVLGFWRSYQLAKMMPRGYSKLPLVQAMWYLPQGIDIWSQILCEFPGHYAREQEKCPTINLHGPRQHFEEHPPYTDGPFDDRLALMVDSIIHGNRVMAFRSFLGLADEAAGDDDKRRRLEANVLYTGIIDLPSPRSYGVTLQIVNGAHKAIRARAMVDLANTFGWGQAYPLFLIVIPDLASAPRSHELFQAANVALSSAFGPDYHDRRLTNRDALNAREIEDFIAVMLHGSLEETVARVTALLEQKKSLVALNDACIVAAARLQANVEHPSFRKGLANTDHAFDYTNVVGYWLRKYDHPQQMKAPYFTALFVTDTARFLRQLERDPSNEFASRPEEHLEAADALSLDDCLTTLARACDEQDAPYATALTNSYLARTRDRSRLIQTLSFESAKFEGDPHLPRNAMSHIEEYRNTTLPAGLRDDIFRSWTRFVSRTHKRSYDYNCLRLFESQLLTSSGNVRETHTVPAENRYGR